MRKTVIEPGGKNGQYLKDLWAYRELFLNFTKRDIIVRYKQTAIGIGWSVINPIVSMFIMTFVFSNLAGMESDTAAPYAIMVYAALLPWQFFAKAVQSTSSIFTTSASLMSKIYFPRIISPISTTITALIDTLISFGIMVIIMVLFQYVPPARIILLPLLLILTLLLSLGVGLVLASYNVKYRDMAQIVPIIVQIGQYVSPVGYSTSIIPAKWLTLYSLNPMVGIIDSFRWCIIGGSGYSTSALLISIIWTAIFMFCGIKRFRKVERTFADIV